MRYIKYSLIFWLCCLPVVYIFGLPKLIATLETKAQTESYAACQKHLTEQNLANVPSAILSPQKADQYCHCVSDNITFSKSDLIELAQQKQPEELNAALAPIVAGCNASLQTTIQQTLDAGPKPRSTWEPDGTETVHFN